MTDTATHPASGRKAIVLSLLTDLVLPLGVFYGLRLAGVAQWWALLLSAVVPVAVIVHRLISRRQLEYFALFILTAVAVGLVLSALTGDPRLMLVRDAWSGMLIGLAGVWFLGSVVVGRPALMTVFRSFVITKVGAEGAAQWAARWEHDAAFRHGLRVLTIVWGVATVLNAVVNLAFAYTLPVDAAPAAMHLVWPVIVVPMVLFHVIYTKRRNLRA
ncbi:MAG TPA: VC0807 family protein [Streptosporangiaceae bacterium]|jgi:hypothetical protein